MEIFQKFFNWIKQAASFVVGYLALGFVYAAGFLLCLVGNFITLVRLTAAGKFGEFKWRWLDFGLVKGEGSE